MEEVKISELDYRGYHLDFFDDDAGQQVYTYIDGECICFGSYNMSFKEDAKYLIDLKLDTISDFSDELDKPLCGTRLTWFDNNGYRDIKLTYRGRLIKVFLVANESKINTKKLIQEARSIILPLTKHEN